MAASVRHIVRWAKHSATGQTQVACCRLCARWWDGLSREVCCKKLSSRFCKNLKQNQPESMHSDAYVCVLSTYKTSASINTLYVRRCTAFVWLQYLFVLSVPYENLPSKLLEWLCEVRVARSLLMHSRYWGIGDHSLTYIDLCSLKIKWFHPLTIICFYTIGITILISL